jgi:tetratricopeptide (TPR) repeat protein
MTNIDPEQQEEQKLQQLSSDFITALGLKENGKFDKAEKGLRSIIRQEPRLAEPHMELARLLLDTDRLNEAEGHSREALEQLTKGGQWTEEIPENVLRALAHALLAEILRRRADEDDVIFGDPEVFKNITLESQEEFKKASELDESDAYSSYYAFFMGNPDDKMPE